MCATLLSPDRDTGRANGYGSGRGSRTLPADVPEGPHTVEPPSRSPDGLRPSVDSVSPACKGAGTSAGICGGKQRVQSLKSGSWLEEPCQSLRAPSGKADSRSQSRSRCARWERMSMSSTSVRLTARPPRPPVRSTAEAAHAHGRRPSRGGRETPIS